MWIWTDIFCSSLVPAHISDLFRDSQLFEIEWMKWNEMAVQSDYQATAASFNQAY